MTNITPPLTILHLLKNSFFGIIFLTIFIPNRILPTTYIYQPTH